MRHVIFLFLVLSSTSIQAETYRWTDPATGRTVISDTAPPGKARNVSRIQAASGADDATAAAIQRAAENAPVVLYTGGECGTPCKQARDLLTGRGIPFTEKLVQSDADFEELRKLVGQLFVPALKVGKQTAKGYNPDTYDELLNNAGYPKPAAGAKTPGTPPQ